jgi:Peptidase family S41
MGKALTTVASQRDCLLASHRRPPPARYHTAKTHSGHLWNKEPLACCDARASQPKHCRGSQGARRASPCRQIPPAQDGSFNALVSKALADLGVSHTGRYTSYQIDYYELLDIYRFALRDDLRRLFPPQGEVSHPGIGLIAKEIDGAFWGGAPFDAAEMFVGRTPLTEMRDRQGKRLPGNVRWRKPVVAIIDEGTRSGLELFAYALKTNGIPLVGTCTAQAVLVGTAYMLLDDSLLMLAVMDVATDGKRLEETGIEPDVLVEREIRYENGTDPQFDAALKTLAKKL